MYKLTVLVHNSNVVAHIDKGMYSLLQAGILAIQLLKDRLAPHGYTKQNHTLAQNKKNHLRLGHE
jgi:hypothetical protein